MPRSVNGLKYYDVQKPPSTIFFSKEDWTLCVDPSAKLLKFFNSKMKLKVSMEARELLSLEPATSDSPSDPLLVTLTYKPPGGPVKGKTLKVTFSSMSEVQEICNDIVRMAPRCQVPRQIRLKSSIADEQLTRESMVWSTLLENIYGFPEEWLANIKPEEGVLELVEEVVNDPQPDIVCQLDFLHYIRLHAVERGTVLLEFAAVDGGVRKISRNVTRTLVLVFVSHAERSNFVSCLTDACSKLEHSPSIHADWLDPIPTASWMRFDAIRWPPNAVLSRGTPKVLLLNTQRRILNFIKSGDVPTGTTVPGNVAIEQMVGLNPGRVLLERSAADETRVTLCIGGSTSSIQNRTKSATEGVQIPLQFASHGERERFCAYVTLAVASVAEQHAALASLGDVAALAVIPSAASEDAASTSEAAQPPAQGFEAGAPSAVPRRTSAATRARQTASTLQAYSNTVGALYGREWPHQPVSVAVATFNAGGVPPPADSASMHDWIPVPHSALLGSSVRTQRGRTVAQRNRTTSQVVLPSNQFDGTTDLYVVGMQELGGQRNRELWCTAVLGHLNTSMAKLAHSRLPLAKGASTMDMGATRPKAGLPPKAASLLDLRERVSSGEEEGGGSDAEEAPQAAAVFRTTRSQTSSTSTLAPSRAGSPSVPDTHRFVLVASEYMWELGIMVFVRASQARSITAVVTGQKATGISLVAGKQLGNKGAVGAAFRWNGVQLSFINAHLAARPERVMQRNEHYKAVMQGLDLCTSLRAQQLGLTAVSEHTWFLGDLNYRVDLPFDDAHSACKELDFARLSGADQLLKQIASGNVLSGFSEGPLEFLPTYRWERSSDFISYKRGQAPSYTDRILHQSLPGVADKLSLVEYTSAPQYYGSDHRPVRALYELSLRTQYLPPPPLLTHTLIPFPTFFSRVDSLFGPVPVIQLQQLRVTGYSALDAPGVMFLSLYSPGLLQSHDPPACSSAVAATGVTQEQAEELVQLKGILHKEEKERRTAEKRGMKMREASEKAMHKAKAAELKANRTTPLGHSDGAGGAGGAPHEGPFRSRGDSVDGDLTDSDTEEGGGAPAAPFTGISTTQHTMMARSDSMSVADPERLQLLALACEYDFPDGVSPVCPALWDPRVLGSSHLVVAAHRVVLTQDGQVAGGEDVDHPIVATAAVPLKTVVDAAAAAVTFASMSASGAGGAQGSARLPGRHRNSTMQVNSFAKTFDEHGVPLPLRCDAAPFSVPLYSSGVKVAQLSGKVALRANTQPGVKEFLAQGDDTQQWLGSDTQFADSLQSLVALMDDMQDAVLPGGGTKAELAAPAAPSARSSLKPGALPSVAEGATSALGETTLDSDISPPEGIEAPTRRVSVERREGAAAGAPRRASKRGSILALHRATRNSDTGTVTPMSRLASTAMLPPAMPNVSKLSLMSPDLKRSHSRTASVARPASKSTTIGASSTASRETSGDSRRLPPSRKVAMSQTPTRRNGSVSRRSLAIPANFTLAKTAVTLPSDHAGLAADADAAAAAAASGSADEEEQQQGMDASRIATADSELSVDSERTQSQNSSASERTSAPSSSPSHSEAPAASASGGGQSAHQDSTRKPSSLATSVPAAAPATEPKVQADSSESQPPAPISRRLVAVTGLRPPPPQRSSPSTAGSASPRSTSQPQEDDSSTSAKSASLVALRTHKRGALKLPAGAVAAASASSSDAPPASDSPHTPASTGQADPKASDDSLVLPSGRVRRLAGKKIVRTSGKPQPPGAKVPPPGVKPPSSAVPAFAKPAVPPPKVPKRPTKSAPKPE